MSIKVVPTSKAMSDLEAIADHIRKFNDAPTAPKIINALLDEAERLGQDHFHRLGEELDGYDGPPAREVHRWVCLAGRYELHYEVLPPYAEEPTTIAVLRVGELAAQDSPAYKSASLVLAGLLKAEIAEREVRSLA